MFEFKMELGKWFNEPKNHRIGKDQLVIVTDPGTDFWQRTYYGFQNDNAHVFYQTVEDRSFTVTVKVTFNTHSLFDQCGVAIYQNSDCWFKAGIEYRNEAEAWMGSVVTNHGYSDWATTMIEAGTTCIWYRLSRRESDFQLESSFDGVDFKQMRIFHLFDGGEAVNIGLLACSPSDMGSFEAVFSDIKVEDCLWQAHEI